MSGTRDLGNNNYAANQIDTSDLLFAGTLTATTDAVALNSGASQTIVEIEVQADPANAGYLLVGNSTAQVIALAAGESRMIPVTDIAKVWVKARSSTQIANWLARGG